MRRSPRRGWLTILFGLFAVLTLVGTTGPVGATGPAPFGSQVAATQWTSTNPPDVSSSESYDGNVSCVSSDFCVATVLQGGSDPADALVQVWNGSSWNTMTVPAPSGQSSYELESASCVSATFCVVVGYGFAQTQQSTPFADEWNGSSWSAGVGVSLPSGSDSAELLGVSCTGPAWCMATGAATNTSTTFGFAIAEQWNGTAWSLAPTPASPGDADGLIGVSCTTPTNCMAVGASAENLIPAALPHLESPVPSASGPGAFGFGAPGLQANARSNADDPHAPLSSEVLAEQWNGSAWTVSPALAPAGTTAPEFLAVSCAGSGFCMATGIDVGTLLSPFAEEWSGGSWTQTSLPPSPSGDSSILEGISCISPTSCTSVGETAFNEQADSGGTYVSMSWNGSGWTPTTEGLPAGATAATWVGVSCLTGGYCVATGGVATGSSANPAIAPSNARAPIGRTGYRLAASDGGVFSYGPTPPDLGVPFVGSMGGQHLNAPIVGMATMPSGDGYYLVGSDGGVFNFGSAQFYGSAGGTHLNAPIVGMAVTADGGGYWLVAADGGVFSYGDAQFWGSAGSVRLHEPVVGMAATPNGLGYYLVGADGGVFTYGNAVFAGSAAGTALNKPIVGMAVTAAGGYYLVGADGGVFNYGDAPLFGSAGGLGLHQPIVGIGAALGGYYLAASDGGVFDYAAPGAGPLFYGSAGGIRLNAPVVGVGA